MAWAATPFASAASCGEARRLSCTIEACGADAFRLHHRHDRGAAASSWLPASITPTVSMNTARARSITGCGAVFEVEAGDEVGDRLAHAHGVGLAF